jgi:uncharacterized protein (DUF924 family)
VAGQQAQDVLDYWLGPDPLDPAALPRRLELWFSADLPARQRARQDSRLARRFARLIRASADGNLDHWASSPNRLLALLLLLDQFPRHVFRGRALAYSRDRKAMALALDGLATGADAALSPAGRVFFYLPLLHAESAEIQEESVAAFRRLAADVPHAPDGLFEWCRALAEEQRDIVRRFGRFPERNAALDRQSTPEELEYLKQSPLGTGNKAGALK